MTFPVPPRPTPRERYVARSAVVDSKPPYWGLLSVAVYEMGAPEALTQSLDRADRHLAEGRAIQLTHDFINSLTEYGVGRGETPLPPESRLVAEYRRNYPSLYHTFEPFRQGERDYALISPDYTGTSVLDLQTGEIIAAEPHDSAGFCPVGFYVPDWWDIHDGSIGPGDEFWDEDEEWPVGDFGFVWGCIWGDDTSWKVEHLDLSDIARGEIRRDARWGYVELATIGDDPSRFIDVWSEDRRVNFATTQRYRLDGSKVSHDWQQQVVERVLNERVPNLDDSADIAGAILKALT